MKERIHYLDVLKGIGIIIVVFAHMNTMPNWGGVFLFFPYVVILFYFWFIIKPRQILKL